MKYINILPKEDGIKAFFSTKDGAVMGAPGGTIYNNEEVLNELGIEESCRIWMKQIHKTNIGIIREEDIQMCTQADLASPEKKGIVLPDTDGIITNVPGVLLTSVHADCLPVYFYDPKKKAIGLVHAGWRGAVAGIAPQAVRKMMVSFGAGPDDIKAAIGPGISKCCFEVGQEVASEFLLEWGNSFSEPVEGKEGKYMLDLKSAVKKQLMDMGIHESNIEVSQHCTCCEPDLFCSYRREGGTYMRMGAGIIMI